ncbi:hypothetical protein [Pseudonocardia sp. NPDC049635]|uniref:hypothetical protein n=1 Tax=Pseudonocardia sp. NPDC049635 TaxID=3155506 RepID=UPI0033E178B8
MTGPTHPGPDPAAPEGPAVAGLAREVEVLRRQVAELEPLPGQVGELGRLVGQLSETLAAVTARRRVPAAPSWLMAPTDPADIERLLGEVCGWVEVVFLRYPDGATALPQCWLWHPDVVEELLWLMHAWCAAYQGPAASVGAAGDWHDRQRPGVVARLRRSVGSCSVEAHQTRPGWSAPTGTPPPVPGVEHVELITRWWATDRDHTPPEPPTAAEPDGSTGPAGGGWR